MVSSVIKMVKQLREQKFKSLIERKLFIRIRTGRFGDFSYQERDSNDCIYVGLWSLYRAVLMLVTTALDYSLGNHYTRKL